MPRAWLGPSPPLEEKEKTSPVRAANFRWQPTWKKYPSVATARNKAET